MTTQGIGASVKRKEDRRFLLGKGQYTDDIVLPDQTYAVFVRSQHAHANLAKVDTAAAKAAAGVRAVLTGADVVADGLGGIPCGWTARPWSSRPTRASPTRRSATSAIRSRW